MANVIVWVNGAKLKAFVFNLNHATVEYNYVCKQIIMI